MGANKRLGRWLLYGLCLAQAVIMLGYYWLEYIPAERQYSGAPRGRSGEISGRPADAVGSRRSNRPRAGMRHNDSFVSGRQADALHH